MPVYSMTGYATAQQSTATAAAESAPSTRRLGLEIRSVNSRFLDLTFKLPEELRASEPVLRTLLDSSLKRGKVEVRAMLGGDPQAGIPLASPAVLRQLCNFQDAVRSWLPDATPFTAAEVMRLCAGNQGAPEDHAETIAELCKQAIAGLLEAREREGRRLAEMLRDRLGQLRALAHQAGPLIPQLVSQQKERFLERWKEALSLADGTVPPESAQDRALTEATAFAIRIDVAEELTRMNSHLDEIERLLKKGGEIGKRLDFLIQELHREANTLGSKSAALELTRISVDMKVLIEQMREQVQNIE